MGSNGAQNNRFNTLNSNANPTPLSPEETAFAQDLIDDGANPYDTSPKTYYWKKEAREWLAQTQSSLSSFKFSDGAFATKNEEEVQDSTISNEFEHEPLPRPQSQIRLLKVTKGPILRVSCNLEIFELDKCPKYTALSYTWGSPLPAKTIHVNGKSFRISQNLWSFLERVSRLRNGDFIEFFLIFTEYIWIDQICIDQRSNDEKGHQIQNMGTIYKQASRVILWLGEESDGSDSAMDTLMDVTEALQTKESHSKLNYDDELAAVKIQGHEPAIAALFAREYWKRLWTHQELLLARGHVITCGGRVIPLYPGALWSVMDALKKKKLYPPNALSAYSVMRMMADGWRHSKLEKLLRWFRDSECTDPRDNVYGMLGLLTFNQDIFADYSKQPDAVFREVMASFVIMPSGSASWVFKLGKKMGLSTDEVKQILRVWIPIWKEFAEY